MDVSNVLKVAKTVGPIVGLGAGVGLAAYDIGKARAYNDVGAIGKAHEVESGMMKRMGIAAGLPIVGGFGTLMAGVITGRQSLVNTGLAVAAPGVGVIAGALLTQAATGEIF